MDLVTMNILDSTLVSICREMGITLMKTSYSTIFNEGLDFTCAIADTNGDMISVAEYCPAQIGGMPLLIKTCSQEIPLDSLSEGDVIIHNDPYRGGLHVPEHTLFMPFFYNGEPLGYLVAIGHVAEVGGMVPGGFAGEATEIFHEGFRVPPVKIRKAGVDVPEVWKLMLANVRTPRYNYGDLMAMIGALEVGSRRLSEVLNKYGKKDFQKTNADLALYSEKRMRAEIEAFPDGRYTFEDEIENDGNGSDPFFIRVEVYVQGDEVVADFSGSDLQAKGPINATLGVTWSATYNALFHLTDPSIPKNSGCFKPIRVLAAPGTVANVNYPAPEVAGNTETHPRLAALVVGALSAGVPERGFAAESGTAVNFVFGGHHPDYDEYFACYDIMSGGWGGREGFDGNDCVICMNGNCRFNPTEVFETRFPWIVEDFAMTTDSGGAGQYRGGLGFQRILRATSTEITASQCTDRHRVGTWGLLGGKQGGNGATLVQPFGRDDWRPVTEVFGKTSSSKYSNITIKPGDKVKLVVPGGGGYGKPEKRERERIEEDINEGFVSEEAAVSDYNF